MCVYIYIYIYVCIYIYIYMYSCCITFCLFLFLYFLQILRFFRLGGVAHAAVSSRDFNTLITMITISIYYDYY